MAGFVALAALMIAAALACVVWPLLRASRDVAGGNARRIRALDAALAAGVIDQSEHAAKRAALANIANLASPKRMTRATFAALLGVALLLPATSLLLYRLVGTPAALAPAAAAASAAAGADAEHATGPQMQEAIATLADRLKDKPDDVEGWALLARAYQATDRAADALDAFKHAHTLAPDNADLTVEYAQALAMATPERRIEGEARALLESALATDANNQRALWLLGIADYQQQKYAAAIARWNTLLPLLAADSSVAASVKQQIADAEARRDGKTPPVRATTRSDNADLAQSAADDAPSTATSSSPAALTVRVALDPALAKTVDKNATLFVFARAEKGPPMPLAVQKLKAGQLPATVRLDDSMSMLPSMTLSKFPRVVVGARISTSSNPLPQSGDLETQSKPLDSHQTAPIALTIDQRVP